MKRVLKYGTGEAIPEGAVYLTTVVQTEVPQVQSGQVVRETIPVWLVWHYYEVVEDA